jgi:hypothetical protein
LLVIDHPLGGERPDSVARRAQQAFEQLSSLINGARSGSAVAGSATEVARVGATTPSNRPPTPQAGLTGPATTDAIDVTLDDDPMTLFVEFSTRQW